MKIEKLLYNIELETDKFNKKEMDYINSIDSNVDMQYLQKVSEKRYYYNDNYTDTKSYVKLKEDKSNQAEHDESLKVCKQEWFDRYLKIDKTVRKEVKTKTRELTAIDLEEFSRKIDVNFKVKSRRLVQFDAPEITSDDFAKQFEKLEILASGLNEKLEDVTFNQKCNVHISGNMLLTINDLTLLEDICTDELQSHLDKGWRIISVNPQANQRRSDYIVGRYNPDKDLHEHGEGAKRK